MRKLLLGTVVLLSATATWSASFDCKNAVTSVENMICEDAYLGKLDEMMATNLKVIKKNNVGKEVIAEIMRTQRVWIKDRNACAGKSCVKESYEKRLDMICRYATVTSGVFWGECLDASDLK